MLEFPVNLSDRSVARYGSRQNIWFSRCPSNWFREHNMSVRSINVVTEHVHARRSRLLFEEALGRDVKVGIIAVPNPDYDASHWWRYSEGVKDVLAETVSYLYARLLFYPSSRDEKAFVRDAGNSKP